MTSEMKEVESAVAKVRGREMKVCQNHCGILKWETALNSVWGEIWKIVICKDGGLES